MTETSTSPALAAALAFHQAWTSKDLDQAMTYIADDITVDAPGARIAGAEQYGGFLTLGTQPAPAERGDQQLCDYAKDQVGA